LLAQFRIFLHQAVGVPKTGKPAAYPAGGRRGPALKGYHHVRQQVFDQGRLKIGVGRKYDGGKANHHTGGKEDSFMPRKPSHGFITSVF
jgi:hypothetical protein